MTTVHSWVADHPAVKSYIAEVCGQVKAKEVHEDIKLEMLSHLEELAEERLAAGQLSHDEAIAEALKNMGRAREIGEGFHAAHRPKPEWSLIALLTGMIVIAVLALFTMPSYPFGNQAINGVKWICGGFGILLMIAFYFMDYRKLLKWSWPLYWVTIGLMTYAWLFGPEVNGAGKAIIIGNFGLDVYTVSSYLLLIAIAGLLYLEQRMDSNGHARWLRSLKAAGDLTAYAWIPSFLYLTSPSLASFVPYAVGLFVLLVLSGRIKLLLASGTAVLLGGIFLFADVSRWMTIKNRLDYIFSLEWANNYQTNFALNTIKSGGMWGQGLGSTGSELPPIQTYSEMLFPNLVYSLGWVFGSFVFFIVAAFVLRTFLMGQRTQDQYGKYLVYGLGSIFAIRLIWNLLMSLGLVPVIGFDLPILNWSSASFFEFAAAGLMLSVYRRKDMIGLIGRIQPVKPFT